MAKLTFEVWDDDEDNSEQMGGVTEAGDKLRSSVSPNAKLVHTFTATSDFGASQQYYDWRGWGEWKPPEGVAEHHFTDAEAEEQERYIARRNLAER